VGYWGSEYMKRGRPLRTNSVTHLRKAFEELERQGHGDLRVIIPFPHYYGEPRKDESGFTTVENIKEIKWNPNLRGEVSAILLTP